MLICEIAFKSRIPESLQTEIDIEVKTVNPSRLTFVTTMRIASECKHHTPSFVMTHTIADTMAAISARELNSTRDNTIPYPIFLFLSDNAETVKSIPTEVAKKADAIVFESENGRKKWESIKNFDKIKKFEVVAFPVKKTDISHHLNDITTLGYVGPIGEGTTLRQFFDKISSSGLTDKLKIIVTGTGKARYVMPIVKGCRANKLNVEWLGETYDEASVAMQLDGFVRSGETFADSEKNLLANGVPCVTANNVTDLFDNELRIELSKKSEKIYLEQFTPEMFKEKVTKLLEAVKCST